MTDEHKTKRDEDDLVLDWDEALDGWDTNFVSSARAEAEPFPSGTGRARTDQPETPDQGISTTPPEAVVTSPPPPDHPGRSSGVSLRPAPRRSGGMYRPPDADEVRAMQQVNELPTPVPHMRPTDPCLDTIDDLDQDDSDRTKIATVPRALIESLTRLDSTDRELNSSNFSMAPETEDDTLLFSTGDSDPFRAPVARDTDPTPLRFGDDGSGVFSPAHARPTRPSLEPVSIRDHTAPEGTEDADGARVLDLAEVDFADGRRLLGSRPAGRPSMPPPTPPDAVRAHEASVLHNLEELAPPARQPTQSDRPAPSLPAGKDRGAAAALRTVRSRKPRLENLPLVGSDEKARRARAAMLQQLAAGRSGTAAYALLTQAAALYEEVGDAATALRLYEAAVLAAPTLPEARRGQARVVLQSGDIQRYASLLEEHAKLPLSDAARAQILYALALCRWLVLDDTAGAHSAATEATRLLPGDVACSSLLARLALRADPLRADASVMALARHIQDPALSAVLLVAAGRAQFERNELSASLQSFEMASTFDPDAVDARLGTARALLGLGRLTDAAQPLTSAARCVSGTPGSALRRQAARLLGTDEATLEVGARLLLDADDAISLRTASTLAMRAGADALKHEVVDAWTRTPHGRDRALALITLAELHSAAGDGTACEQALQAAAGADPQLSLVAVVREVLARARGDSATLAEMSATEGDPLLGSLSAAAKLALTSETRDQELTWLERAQRAGVDLACVHTILADVSAELGALLPLRSALHGLAAAGAVEARLGATLALSDLERRNGQPDAAAELVGAAAELDARSLVTARAVLRQTSVLSLQTTLWRKEAEATRGTRAAFAYLREGHLPGAGAAQRLAAFVAAHEAAPTYTPATWALHQEARRQGDLNLLSELHSRDAGRAKDPLDAVAHLVRAALIRANQDADGAAAQLARALDLAPTDPVLRELVLRLGDAVPATLRAEAMLRTAEHAPPPLKRAALLAAAGAFEDANQPEQASALYASVLATHPDDPIAEMGYERVAPLAGKTEELLVRRRTAVESAVTPATKVKALEELMAIDGTASSELSATRAQAILDIDPYHALSLRFLERLAMEQNDLVSLAHVEAQLLERSSGSYDKAARLRVIAFAHAQGTSDPSSAELDRLLLGPGLTGAGNPWLARQLMGAALSARSQEGLERAEDLLFEACAEPIEIAAAAIVRAGDQRHQAASDVLRRLEEALAQYPEHPLAQEALAEAKLRAGDARGAAQHFETAAGAALTPLRAARLWYRAGLLWQDELHSPDRARDAFRAAATRDILYADVQTRLESLLTGRNDLAGLIELTEARLRSDGPPEQLAEVHRSLAKLHEKRSDRSAARNSLRAAMSVAPDHLASLRDYAEVCERDHEWRECAEALIRLARLSHDQAELREVFFRLGEIYDVHLPDARRAEAAYRRVLKLGPKHPRALERLAALYQRENQVEPAIEALGRLAQVAESPVRRREAAFELARLREAHGDPRGAEETLEALRRAAPKDLHVMRGLADFYRRQDAGSALAMHLNRAANDLREGLAEELDDAALWSALVEVLDQRGRRDAVGVCASAAYALGLADAGVVAHTDAEGGVAGVGGAAFSELLDDLLYPETMNPAIRVVFRYGAEALNKAVPFDVRLLGGERLDKKHPLRGTSQEIARWMSVDNLEIYVTEQLPCAFVPIQDAPVTLLVGRTLLDGVSRGEAQFLVARALKIARAQLSLACRVRPDEVGMMLHALIRAHSPEYAPEGVDLALIDEWGRRIGKHLGRKAREELSPHLVELEGATNFEPARVYEMGSMAASRAALLATGSVPSAATALCKLAGLPASARHNALSMADVAETRDLLLFAISEAHFEARQRAGADRH